MMTWGDGSECRYVSSTGFFGIVFGLLAGVGFGYIANKSRKDKGIGYRMWMMVFVMMNAGLTLVSLVAACMLTIGFKTISNILGSQMCSPIITNGKLSNFVLLHSLSEVSAWIGTIINFLLTGISIVTLLRNRGRLQSRDTKNINLNTTRLPSIG
ncbi:uncharacterized protein LOC132745858 isoform X2 [Ruditapes philippinarum]|nr:uncharacterized protein LOC132745858 isoform X2 [Ruditapes philippinarum]